MIVTKKQDVKAGLERLGLQVEEGSTKVEEWTRLFIHEVVEHKEEGKELRKVSRYICRMSFRHGILISYRFFGMPDFYAYAIRLMIDTKKILSHINFFAIGQKAYNATFHLKERADEMLTDRKKYRTEKDRKAMHHKAMLHYHWEKQKLFTSLFNERYYNGLSPSTKVISHVL